MTVISARTPAGDCGKIAPGEGDPGVFCGVEETIEELVGPALGQIGGHGKG